MAREVRVNPTFGSRKWVKLWVNEWLDGTTRFEMSDAQRAFWTDLLAMAGRSRFPGVICAGQIDGHFVGYPINKFQALMSEPIDVEATFALFEKNRKIEVEVTQESSPKLFKLTLLNWERYQSEYQRQKPYRQKLHKGDAGSYKKGDTTEVEVRSRSEKKSILDAETASGAAEPPEVFKTLSDKELKGLRKTLERTLRDRRIPASYRESTRVKLNQVSAILDGRS